MPDSKSPVSTAPKKAFPTTAPEKAPFGTWPGFADEDGRVPARGRTQDGLPPAPFGERASGPAEADAALRGAAARGAPTGRGFAPTRSLAEATDRVSDAEALRRSGRGAAATAEALPRRPEDLPAVINKAVALAGARAVPKWRQVKHLPGYLAAPIRALGRQVFGSLTDTPIEDIQILSTLTNPKGEVDAASGWLRRNGAPDDAMRMEFEASFPGYKADVVAMSSEGFSFLLVRDFAGEYIYAWPGGRGVAIGTRPAAAALPGRRRTDDER